MRLSCRSTVAREPDRGISFFVDPCWDECDAESVVKCCCLGSLRDITIDPVIFDCALLFALLNSSRISFAKMECNQVAHALVSLAKQFGTMYWQRHVRDPVPYVVCKDATDSLLSQSIK